MAKGINVRELWERMEQSGFQFYIDDGVLCLNEPEKINSRQKILRHKYDKFYDEIRSWVIEQGDRFPSALPFCQKYATPAQMLLVEPPAQMSFKELAQFLQDLKFFRAAGRSDQELLDHFRYKYPKIEMIHLS